MNDRFNIRYFNKNTKKFEYLKIGAVNFNLFTDWTVYEQGQFCTGLKDKNGKLIYEGDIVKNNQNSLYSVEFEEFQHQTKFCLKRVEIPNYYPHISTWQGIGYKDQNDYEVIGNIYENKELLESEG